MRLTDEQRARMEALGLTEADVERALAEHRRREEASSNAVHVGKNGRLPGSDPLNVDAGADDAEESPERRKLALPSDRRVVYAPLSIPNPRETWSWVIGARLVSDELRVRKYACPAIHRFYEARDNSFDRDVGGIWHDVNIRIPVDTNEVLVFVRINREPGNLDDYTGREPRPEDTLGIFPKDVASEARLLARTLGEHFRLARAPGINSSREAEMIVYGLCMRTFTGKKKNEIRLPKRPEWD